MDIRQEIISILQDDGYRVQENFDGISALYFEDSTIMGFASIEENHYAILQNWKRSQDEFLRLNAKSLRSSPVKAWNAYSIFLTAASCSEEEKRELYLIEEDFQGTRKIARSEVLTRDDLTRALYPILAIRNIAPLRMEEPLERLWTKVSLPPKVRDAFLSESSPEELADLLLADL